MYRRDRHTRDKIGPLMALQNLSTHLTKNEAFFFLLVVELGDV